jgi:hypothetical protein
VHADAETGSSGVDACSDAGVKVVTADLARPHGLAHDSVKLGDALAALLP